MHFDGETYVAARDEARLTTLYERVVGHMADGFDHTLPEIARATGGTEASVSARLRDMRKERNGSHVVDKTYIGNGLWTYKQVR